ncbi:MAG: hypothetical protein RML94_11245 [Bacteroidia bacterium]|nr:hypothetical protein [Bacteroidia bacterium]
MTNYIFGRVPRCARVGLLRTTLTLGATLRFALPYGTLHSPHASCILMFYLVFMHIFALLVLCSLSSIYNIKIFTLFEIHSLYFVFVFIFKHVEC